MKKTVAKTPDCFVQGVWYAIQQLVIFHGEDGYAELIALESGIDAEEFGLAQKLNAYENRVMNLFLRKAFPRPHSRPSRKSAKPRGAKKT